MATTIPAVTQNEALSKAWSDLVATAVAEIETAFQLGGPTAVTFTLANWSNYGTVHADLQVMRFGYIVIMVGLVKNNTGAAVAPPITISSGGIPAGFRPRAVGAVAPLGGNVMACSQASGGSPGMGRLDVTFGGSVQLNATAGNFSVSNGGFFSTVSAWVTE